MKIRYGFYIITVVALGACSAGCSKMEEAATGGTQGQKTGVGASTQPSVVQNPAIPDAAKDQIKARMDSERAAAAAAVPAALRNKPVN